MLFPNRLLHLTWRVRHEMENFWLSVWLHTPDQVKDGIDAYECGAGQRIEVFRLVRQKSLKKLAIHTSSRGSNLKCFSFSSRFRLMMMYSSAKSGSECWHRERNLWVLVRVVFFFIWASFYSQFFGACRVRETNLFTFNYFLRSLMIVKLKMSLEDVTGWL